MRVSVGNRLQQFIQSKECLIVWVLLLAFLLRFYVLWHYKLNYISLHSDDQGYINSAIRLLQLGRLTYHSANEHTVHMMPGISVLLASVFAVFGWGSVGIYAAKFVMILIGTAGVLGVYLVGRRIWNLWVGLIAALLCALYVPMVLTDNLLLTETPFMTSFLFLVLFTLRLAETKRTRDCVWMVVFYLIALMFRPTVAIYPLVVFIYFLAKRYPWRLMAKHAAIGLVIVCAVLAPWWARNYHYYHKFIPLTAGTGDPMLLGTYQGERYPKSPTIDQVLHHIHAERGFDAYAIAGDEAAAAKARMSQWWHEDKSSMIYSYAYLKPQKLWNDSFYWIKILGVDFKTIHDNQPTIVSLGLWGYLVAFLLSWRRKREILLICLTLTYYTALYSLYFVFGRYSEPLLPFIFLGIGAGIYGIVSAVAKLVGRRRRTA